MKYIDTSAFVKYFGDPEVEKGSGKVTDIIFQAEKGDFILISFFLMIGEAISVFDKWVRREYITKDELDKILGKFFSIVEELGEKGALILADLDTLTVAFSIEYILKHNIPINDAVHLYAALGRKSSIDEFICSDKNLKRAAEKEGFKILDPEE
ncbi:type II toxin-antitoxin system VapC family toxin [Thermodesulfovibrionales bacterium]|nr:type II toxin-antitoxin system VapC family toxin [Thermodesulfovibrionales bacterium]